MEKVHVQRRTFLERTRALRRPEQHRDERNRLQRKSAGHGFPCSRLVRDNGHRLEVHARPDALIVSPARVDMRLRD